MTKGPTYMRVLLANSEDFATVLQTNNIKFNTVRLVCVANRIAVLYTVWLDDSADATALKLQYDYT